MSSMYIPCIICSQGDDDEHVDAERTFKRQKKKKNEKYKKTTTLCVYMCVIYTQVHRSSFSIRPFVSGFVCLLMHMWHGLTCGTVVNRKPCDRVWPGSVFLAFSEYVCCVCVCVHVCGARIEWIVYFEHLPLCQSLIGRNWNRCFFQCLLFLLLLLLLLYICISYFCYVLCILVLCSVCVRGYVRGIGIHTRTGKKKRNVHSVVGVYFGFGCMHENCCRTHPALVYKRRNKCV